jgi:hypothetical protein
MKTRTFDVFGLQVEASVRLNPHHCAHENDMGRAAEPMYLVDIVRAIGVDGWDYIYAGRVDWALMEIDYEITEGDVLEALVNAYEKEWEEPAAVDTILHTI